MTEAVLRIALLADGSSDRALIHVIRWVIQRCAPAVGLVEEFRTRAAAQPLHAEMLRVVDLLRPDILFVHRDAEAQSPEVRRAEIPDIDGRLVRVVPVRMTEAWLLFDERAIRIAAGNPSGRDRLDLPRVAQAESVSDPKQRLHDAIRIAAAASGRRLKQLNQKLPSLVQRVAELIDDFAPLRCLPAFAAFENSCKRALGA